MTTRVTASEFFSILYSLSKVVYYDWRENKEKGFDARVELIEKEKKIN